MKLSATTSSPPKSPARISVSSARRSISAPRSPQTPSLPDAGPSSGRPRYGGRKSNFLAGTVGVLQGSGTGEDTVSIFTGFAVLPQTPESFQYDADGNLTQDGKWTYKWDAENRLIEMDSLSSVPPAAQLKLTFAYDWQGRRIEKNVYTWNSSISSCTTLHASTLFIYDGWNLVAELDATNNNNLLRGYLWGQDLSGSLQGAGGISGLVALTTTGSNAGTYLLSYDANGNVLGLLDSQGKAAGTYEYGPFGEVVRSSGPMAGQNPFQFSTKYRDSETGLNYYGYRYYNPSTGRWISRDPLEEIGGRNLYGFCLNDPVDQEDLLGLISDQDLINMLAKELLPNALNDPACIQAIKNLVAALTDAAKQLAKYNPITDAQGGIAILRGGKPIGRNTVPGGHAEKANNALNRVQNAIKDVIQKCKTCKGDPVFSPESLNEIIQEAE